MTQPMSPSLQQTAPLALSLGLITREQVDNDKLEAKLAAQGLEKPNNPDAFKLWLCQQSEAIVICVMGGGSFIEVIYSLVQYVSPGRMIYPKNNKLIGALGDSEGDGREPVFVKIRDCAFECKSVKT